MLRGCLNGRKGFGGSRTVVRERDCSAESEVAETLVEVLAFASDEEVFSVIEEIVSVVLDGGLAMDAEAVFGGYFLKKVRRRGGNERASSMCCCVMCETVMANGGLEGFATRAAVDVSWRSMVSC